MVAHAHGRVQESGGGAEEGRSPFAFTTTSKGVWCEKIPGRFRSLRVEQLALIAWMYRTKTITRRQLRVWFALHEMAERRRYTQEDERGRLRYPSYGLEELRSLVGGPDHAAALRGLGRDVQRLSTLGLASMQERSLRFAANADELEELAWGEGGRSGFDAFFAELPNRSRRVPMPRRLTRALASGFTPAATVLVIALLMRTLHWHRAGGPKGEGGYRVDGRIKLSWVANTFSVSRRALSVARSSLTDLGLVRTLPATQWQLNRWGSRCMLDVGALGPEGLTPGAVGASESASLGRESALQSASPDLNSSSSPYGREQDNRKSAPGRAGTPVGGRKKLPEPSLKNVVPEDLVQLPRTLVLHRQAVAEGLVSFGDNGRLEFLATVERARAEGLRPERLLVWLLRQRHTDWVSAHDEERATARLRVMNNGERQRPVPPPVAPPPEPFTSDELVVQASRIVGGQRRLDPFLVARSQRGWDRERWDAAAGRLHAREVPRPVGAPGGGSGGGVA